MKKILFSALVALTVTAPAYAATGNTSTAAGAAAANVITPIVLTHVSGATLNFGSFTTGTGGSVSVDASGAGVTGGDVSFVPGTSEAADQFTVLGDKSRSFSISTTGGTVANGATTIAFSTVPSAAAGTTSATGTAGFSVGGTLTVIGTEAAGAYTGTYNATVTYN
ncbi:DUF4402 domain-containing protein [Novosphingobium sp.]|uniref:DUF4402 domain-containing protein n=1 Tax=Novosphingobium sp. TaxID=1874826 RepID=UPI003340B589